MQLDTSLVGRKSGPVTRSWKFSDALLYALAVGAGQRDPFAGLEFTTDNSINTRQRVLPTFANVVMSAGLPLPDGLDLTKMLHGEQAFELHRELEPEGEAVVEAEIVGVYDKGSGASVAVETTARTLGGEPIATLLSSVFFRGCGGFGGDRGPKADWKIPSREPDHIVVLPTRTDQALLYRLTGDRNPLHSDPAYSAQGGYPVPILHGMCTYGIAGRALLETVAQSDPSRFTKMSGRFTKPVLPGETLVLLAWVDGPDVRFRTIDSAGDVVLDHGTATIK